MAVAVERVHMVNVSVSGSSFAWKGQRSVDLVGLI